MNAALILKYSRYGMVVSLSSLALAAGQAASATQLIYTPVNPTFGGNPLNGNYLLSKAQATNTHKPSVDDGDLGGLEDQTPLQQFNESLQRSILSRIAASATSSIIGADGTLKPGIVNTPDFTITVVDSGGGMLTITTTDKATGASTSFQVGG